MPDRSRRRAGAARIRGRARASELARRLGIGLKEARTARALRQSDVGDRAGVTQAWISRMERGLGQAASIETWAAVATAVDRDLAAFLQDLPGATRPHDYQHLKRQELVIRASAAGGWRGHPEVRVRDGVGARSVDVLLSRSARREAAVVEIWDLFDDVGAAWRGLDAKIAAVSAARGDDAVSGVLVVRGTRRNRSLVAELRAAFRARHPGSSAAWLRALMTDAPMPTEPGFLWTDVPGTKLLVARL